MGAHLYVHASLRLHIFTFTRLEILLTRLQKTRWTMVKIGDWINENRGVFGWVFTILQVALGIFLFRVLIYSDLDLWIRGSGVTMVCGYAYQQFRHGVPGSDTWNKAFWAAGRRHRRARGTVPHVVPAPFDPPP